MEFQGVETAQQPNPSAPAPDGATEAAHVPTAAEAQPGHEQSLPDQQQAGVGEAPHTEEHLQGVDHRLPHIPQDLQQGPHQVLDPGAVPHIDPSALLGVPPGLAALHQQVDDAYLQGGKFKPVDLESLSPKSRQRVLRNRQAATRSKAKKKQQYQLLKDKKTALAEEILVLEAQLAGTQERIAQLHGENKALLDTCKCPKPQMA